MEFFNPDLAGEMALLLMNNQKNYVPWSGEGEMKKVITPIPFHGDQLFEERARNVIGLSKMGTMNLIALWAFIQSLQTGMQKLICMRWELP